SFLKEFQRVAVGSLQRATRETDDQNGLLLIAGFDDALFRAREIRDGQLGEGFSAAFPGGELLFHGAPGNLRIDVAEDCEDGVIGNYEPAMEVAQLLNREMLDAWFSAKRMKSIAHVAEQFLAHQT